jgi:hypothetical protein
MSTTSNYVLIAVSTVLLIIATILYVRSSPYAGASAPIGLPASVTNATTSNLQVSNAGTKTLFATSSGCSARIISTATTSLMLTFTDNLGQSPSAIFGVWQAASTTVAYDSGLYGCGLVKGFSFGTGMITLFETE